MLHLLGGDCLPGDHFLGDARKFRDLDWDGDRWLAQTAKPAKAQPPSGSVVALKGGKVLTVSHGVIENGIVVIQGGEHNGKLAAIVEIIDNKRVCWWWFGKSSNTY